MFGNNSSVFSKIIKENLTNRAFFFILPSWIFTLACYNLRVPKKEKGNFLNRRAGIKTTDTIFRTIKIPDTAQERNGITYEKNYYQYCFNYDVMSDGGSMYLKQR